MVYPESGEIFEGIFDKDMREGVGYQYHPNGTIYCGQYRQDNEEGLGEFLIEKPDIKFAIDFLKIE